MIPFAVYLRTSTDDHQSPQDSAAWQLRLVQQLITPVGGEIIATYHDIDQSRSIPWARRPEAKRLLDDTGRPDRGWSDLVVAEPQRAFAGNQFGLVYPVLVHYGVSLWVPEVGGRVDPDSEAHDLVMSLFGGLAKAERNRIRHRVRTAMAAHASSGRWLGGRPPYGYLLVDLGLHPNPEKASVGIHLRALRPDPATAEVVQRIFDLYASGLGFRSIAAILTGEDVPCPSAHDPARNPHRSGHAWSAGAIRAILTNPRYKGHQVYGRFGRKDDLIDPAQPALGHQTRLKRQPEDTWVYSETEAHPPLIDEATWKRVQTSMASKASRTRPPRSQPGRYALRGLLRCAHCDRTMQGNHSRGLPFYRCRLSGPDYASAPPGHPSSLAVQERRLLTALDGWLTAMFTADNIQSLAQEIVTADAEALTTGHPGVIEAKRIAGEARTKLARYVNAIENGVDPALLAKKTTQAQADLAHAEQTLATVPVERRVLTVEEVVDVLSELRELPTLLDDADPEKRGGLYRCFGLDLAYRRGADREYLLVRSTQEGVDLNRVGGGT